MLRQLFAPTRQRSRPRPSVARWHPHSRACDSEEEGIEPAEPSLVRLLSLPVTDNATMRQRLPRSPVHKPLSLHSECDNTSDNRMPAQRREPLLSLPRTLDEVDYVVGVDTHSFRTHSSITQNSR